MSRIEDAVLMNYENINIISDNIANTSTIGYKSRKPIFFDIFSNSLYSQNHFGYGIGISNIVQDFSNGEFVNTQKNFDLAITDDGFFKVIDSQGKIHFTRNGQFKLDKNQNILNSDGMFLTGSTNISNSVNEQNYFANNYSNAKIINLADKNTLAKKSTSEITIKALLNDNTNILPKKDDFNLQDNIWIYKNNGEKEKLNITFKKVNEHVWSVNITSDSSDVPTTFKKLDESSTIFHIDSTMINEKNINQTFQLEFDDQGKLISHPSVVIKSKNPNYENITIDCTDTIETSDIPESNNVIKTLSQNGYHEGQLRMIHFTSDGTIIGKYDNEQEQKIGQILLSKFINPEALKAESGNIWSATEESGREQIGIPGTHGLGMIHNCMLEMSNVNLNKELINMILAQRNYQSSMQIFKTEDKMINTLIDFH